MGIVFLIALVTGLLLLFRWQLRSYEADVRKHADGPAMPPSEDYPLVDPTTVFDSRGHTAQHPSGGHPSIEHGSDFGCVPDAHHPSCDVGQGDLSGGHH